MKLNKNILGSLIWRGAYFATVFVLNIVIARYFKAAGSGWIYYVTSYFSFIILLVSFCLESGMTFFAASNTIGRGRLSLFAFSWSIVVSLLVATVLLLFSTERGSMISKNEFAVLAGMYTCGVLLTTYYSSLFYASQDFELPNVLLTGVNLVLLLVAGLIIWLDHGGEAQRHFLQLYFFSFLLQGLLLAVVYIVRNKLFGIGGFLTGHELQMLLRYSLFAFFSNIVFFLLYRVDYWFVKNYCTVCQPADLGAYIQASKLGQLFLVLPAMIANVLFPATAGGSRSVVNSLLPVLCRVFLCVYIIILLPIIAIGGWLFPFVFGDSFNGMYLPFVLLIPGVLSLSCLAFVSAYFAGKDKVRVNLVGSLLALIVVLGGDILFIPRYGIQGAAAVSSLAYITCYLYSLFRFKADYGKGLRHFFVPQRNDFVTVYNYLVQRFKPA